MWLHHLFCTRNCFGSLHAVKKRQVTKQLLRVWWKGMQVVLSEHLSSSYDQGAHLEPSFLLQKKRIHDTICLGVPHAARGPNAHLPCSRVVTGACCVLVWPGLSPCGTALGLKGTASRLAFPLARCFWWAEMVVLLLAPAWTPWVLSRKSLHHVPGRGTDMPPVSLSRLAGLPTCKLRGKCVWMVFCREMQLDSVLWAGWCPVRSKLLVGCASC